MRQKVEKIMHLLKKEEIKYFLKLKKLYRKKIFKRKRKSLNSKKNSKTFPQAPKQKENNIKSKIRRKKVYGK